MTNNEKDELIKAQYEDTKQLVERGVINSDKLCRDRVYTLLRRLPNRIFTWFEINEWFEKNHPEVPSGRDR